MKNIMEKISSYNLYNYLFPGVIFVVISDKMTSYSFLQDNIVIGAFVYYFIGLVVSRFGSLVVEPALKKINFLEYSKYGEYISASKEDKKIELFSEVNNMYRTISSLFVLLIILKIYEWIENFYPTLKDYNFFILTLLLLVVFLLSYRKQTSYITKH
ncbi:MAG: hypothetical protein PHU28_06615 [Methanosarcinaceae archaeon]|nr:hypothetical protein [Methanosarcinaceae archaeon]